MQGTEPLTLTHLGSCPTGLQAEWLSHNSMAVMPSGKVYRKRKHEPPGFHIYSSSAEDWRKLKQLPGLCEHKVLDMMSPVTIGNQELLAVSCWKCRVNLETGESSTAFRDPQYEPYSICEGEEGQMFVRCWDKQRKNSVILLLDCSSQTFTALKHIETKGNIANICYVPRHKLIVSRDSSSVRAFDCESGKVRWTTQMSGYAKRPVYFPDHDAVLVYSGQGFLVNASDGEVRQELQLPREVDDVWDMRLHDGQLVVLHGYPERKVVSFFSLR